MKVALSIALFGSSHAAQVTPIQKVLTMMGEMKAKGIAEKEDEATKYSAFEQWCGNQQRVKTNEVSAGNDKMEQLKATIEKEAVSIRKLTDRIEELDEDVANWSKDKSAAQGVRTEENAEYRKTLQDYDESLSALNDAIATLQKRTGDVAQASASLLQLKRSKVVPDEAKSALSVFLEQSDPDERLFHKAPEANAYEFQSGGIVEMLEKLKDEFDGKRSTLVEEETKAQHAFDSIAQQLTTNINNAMHESSQRNELRQKAKQNKAEAEGDLVSTTNDRDEDQRYLDETVALCMQKAKDFAARQQLRADEIEAISKAMEIIGSGEVAGAGEKHLPTMFMQKSLAHLRSSEENPLQSQAASFLADRARISGSRLLTEAAEQAAANPFGKVKKLIKDLISKLMQEAAAEAEKHGFCQAELAKNKQTRESRTADVNSLTNDIDGLNADIASLTQDISDLATAVKELDQAVSDETETRMEAKAKNAQTLKEAREAQTAVESAMAVMKDFYAKAATATAFVQQSSKGPADDAPEMISDEPYQGMAGSGGNIVDFLEVILTDFERLESETAASEESESEEYKNFMFESKKDKALKENESKHKSNTKTDKESALHSAQAELKSNQEQLAKANEYYAKLKPSCVDSGITYEERVKQREAEMQSLSEALKILQGQDLPTLR